MEKITQENWWYTIDELGRFHSEWDAPAIHIKDHIAENGDPVSWYMAWYEHGKLTKSTRNSWEEYLYEDWNLVAENK